MYIRCLFSVYYCVNDAGCSNNGNCGSDGYGCSCNNGWDIKPDCSGNSCIFFCYIWLHCLGLVQWLQFLKQFVHKIFITFLLTLSYSSQVQPKTLLTTSNKKYIQLPFFSQSSIVLMKMTATTRDFAAQMVHACVNQDGRAIWIAQVNWSENVQLIESISPK